MYSPSDDEIGFDWLCPSEAKKEYFLNAQDLSGVPFKRMERIRFYDPDDLEEVALKKHGKEGLSRKRMHRSKREEDQERKRKEAFEKKQKMDPQRKKLNEYLVGNHFCLVEHGKHIGHVGFEKSSGRVKLHDDYDETLWIDDVPLAAACRGNESDSTMWDEWQKFQVEFKIFGDYIKGKFSVKVENEKRVFGHFVPKYEIHGEWTSHDFQLVEECASCEEANRSD